jgi:hypothetical protein
MEHHAMIEEIEWVQAQRQDDFLRPAGGAFTR